MESSSSFKVAPRPAITIDPSKVPNEGDAMSGCGLLGTIICLCSVFIGLVVLPDEPDSGEGVMVGTVGTVISLTVLIASVVNSRKRRVRKAEELGLSASLDEAEAATSRLTALYRSLPNGLRQLMVQIGQELTALRVA